MVAGYHDPGFQTQAQQIGFDGFVAHYSSLPDSLGPTVKDFSDMNFMAEFKKEQNRERLRRWSTDLRRQADAEDGVGLQGAAVSIQRRPLHTT